LVVAGAILRVIGGIAHHLHDVFAPRVDNSGGTDAARRFQSFIAQVGDGDFGAIEYPISGRRHQTDGAGTDDEHALRLQMLRQANHVNAVANWFGKAGGGSRQLLVAPQKPHEITGAQHLLEHYARWQRLRVF
jgi:hypothetical protein